jgi:hypothetical protein
VSDTIARVLERLDGVRQVGADRFVARCPAHDDRRASLSVALGRDQRVLLYDYGGCPTETILTALQMTWGDLFATTDRPERRNRPVTTSCELDEIRHALLAKERRLAARRERWAEVIMLADEARAIDRLVDRARRVVTNLGDVPAAWDLEDQATSLERLMRNAEAGAHVAVAGRSLW